jgi:hypothetical protein
VVGIVEKQLVSPNNLSMPPDVFDKGMIVPFVDYDEVCSIELTIQIQRFQIVTYAGQTRIGRSKPSNRAVPIFGQEVSHTPSICRLIHLDIMTPRQQLGCYPPKEVGIAMIPVRNERMIEHYHTQFTVSPLMLCSNTRV